MSGSQEAMQTSQEVDKKHQEGLGASYFQSTPKNEKVEKKSGFFKKFAKAKKTEHQDSPSKKRKGISPTDGTEDSDSLLSVITESELESIVDKRIEMKVAELQTQLNSAVQSLESQDKDIEYIQA